MTKFEKFEPRKHIRGLVEAARRIQAEEANQELLSVFVAPVPNCVVRKLREMKVPITRQSYAMLAYWRPYRTLAAEEKAEVRQAVYDANIQ